MRSDEIVLEAAQVYKSYGHVQALRGASLQVRRGEVIALVGDNGAGKSTLMKCMCGAVQPDQGEIRILGQSARLTSIRAAHELGVQTVYQDLALAPDLSVQANIFLGAEPLKSGILGRLGVLSQKTRASRSDEALRALGINLPTTNVAVEALSGGQRQAVAIARAVRWAKNAILMDEPTAALGTRQSEIVLETIREMARRGLGVLVISHDMPRIREVADRIIVLRHGAVVADLPGAQATIPSIVAAMLGASEERADGKR